jgi:hypothetical protein
MSTAWRLAAATVLIVMPGTVCYAQSITSAHSGTLHYFEGSVAIDGTPVESKVTKFPEIRENSILSTGQGRAEILLTPGVFLRVGENTSVKMLDRRLMSTRVEFISGSAIVESDDPEVSAKEHKVTIVHKDYQIQPLKFGLFEITSDPGQVTVFKGQANVMTESDRTVVRDGHLLPLSAALLSEKFDTRQEDDLYLWTRDRSAYISAANMSSARSLRLNGYVVGRSFPGLGFSHQFQGEWYLNSALGMYTYMPYAGTVYSPFGYGLFSPGLISSYYSPTEYYWYGGGGSRTGSMSGVPLTGLTSSEVLRLGAVRDVHPTLASPLRGISGSAASSAASAGSSSASDRAALEAKLRKELGECDSMEMAAKTYSGN